MGGCQDYGPFLGTLNIPYELAAAVKPQQSGMLRWCIRSSSGLAEKHASSNDNILQVFSRKTEISYHSRCSNSQGWRYSHVGLLRAL